MTKIPVMGTIGATYRFAFGGFFANLGVTWLPILLTGAAVVYALPLFAGEWINAVSQTALRPGLHAPMFLAMGHLYRVMLLGWLALLFIRAQVMAGLTRRALGLSTGPTFVYLSLGATFWRVFGAYLAVSLIIWAVELVTALAGAVVIAVLGGLAVSVLHGLPGRGDAIVAGLAGAVAVVALVLFVLYIAVRLTFLLTAALVDEERFDLLRPWELAGGNVLRIVAIGLAVLVPLVLLMALMVAPLEIGAVLPLIAHLPAHGQLPPDEAAKTVKAIMTALVGLFRSRWYLLAPLYLIGETLIYGAAAGAGAYGWRALVPKSGA